MEQETVLAARQIAILSVAWLLSAASGLTWAITERRYHHACRLVALGAYSGFVGLAGALAVFVWSGISVDSEPLVLCVSTFLGLLGKTFDEYKGQIARLFLRKAGVVLDDTDRQ